MLCKYVWDSQPHKRLNFTELIKTVVKELVCIYCRLYGMGRSSYCIEAHVEGENLTK